MKKNWIAALACALVLLAAPALADKAPAVLEIGRGAAACHLATHLQAYTDGWDGLFVTGADGKLASSSACTLCEGYGHVHCYGRRVKMYDSPFEGDNNALWMQNTRVGLLGPDVEFQLVDVVKYRNKFYAMVRVMNGEELVVAGWCNADYIGCDCKNYADRVEIPVYDSYDTFFE